MRFVAALLLLSGLSWAAQSQSNLRGLEWEDEFYNQLPLKASYFKYALPPPSYYSLKQFCPRVVNQANSNTGVAWAAVWYARTMLDAIKNNWRDQKLITTKAFGPLYNYQKVIAEEGCDSKVKLSAILQSLQNDGALLFSEYHEMCMGTITPEQHKNAALNKLPGFVRLFFTTDSRENKIMGIKKALYNNHPVVLGMITSPSFSMATDFWQPRSDPDRENGGHAVTVVGYNDSMFGGAFEVVNSWGLGWGKQGFSWLRYDEVERYVLYGYELLDGTGEGGELSASFNFATKDGSQMAATDLGNGNFKINNPYPTGTIFNVQIEFNQPIFFYSLLFSETWDHFKMYPLDPSISPWITQDFLKFPLWAPSDIVLTDPPGKNFLVFIVSGSAVDTEQFAKDLKYSEGSYLSEVNSKNSLSWSPNKIEFTGTFQRKSTVALMVELDQVAK